MVNQRIFVVALSLVSAAAQPYPTVKLGRDGKLVYTPDFKGNTVVDFSSAGYRGGGVPLPDVPAKIFVSSSGDRARDRIQAAIDVVSALPRNANGFRGAVLLGPGRYRIEDNLHIAASGVVLRGVGSGQLGSGQQGTVLVAAGTSRRALIEIAGSGKRTEVAGSRKSVADAYVPVGATTIALTDTAGIHIGDRIIVQRPSTAEWISLLGMNRFQGWRANERLHWLPGSRDISWDRVVAAVEGGRIHLDAPLTTALDREYGAAFVYRYEFPGRIDNVGVENLALESPYDAGKSKDEDHSWFAIHLDKVENAWVRQISALHFVSYVINADADSHWVTIEDCEAADPVGEDASYRGRAFYTGGQQTLFHRCHSRRGRQDFSTGFAAAGPIVFLDCDARESTNYSGPLDSWASGVLFDNVRIRGNAIRLTNRGAEDQGAGWAAANSIVWNSEATDIEVQSPPGAYNEAYGSRGSSPWDSTPDRGNPYSDLHRGTPETPRSLYLQQLGERSHAAKNDTAAKIPSSSENVRRLSEADLAAFTDREARMRAGEGKPLRVENGRFTIDGKPAWTARTGFQFFLAQMPPALAPKYGPAITRFAPGRTGLGLTDDLDELAASMGPGSVFYHNYGLWYDRRRVNHNFDGSAERRTGDVWAPFIELPWERSGIGKAWDGLSKYDLMRFNPWFFDRVKRFADLCDRKGLILYHAFYFQHWVLETNAHYVDFPWRPANTIQDTGLPDQNPAAAVFYDVSSPLRRRLHRLYIRKCLDNLKDNTNVVYGIDREYTGPVEFVRFWLDTISDWEKENGKHVNISLEIPKDQTDTLLRDPKYRPMIAAIGFHGWNYRADGVLFAIRGGIDKAPREQETGILTDADWRALRKMIADPSYLGSNITYATETVQMVRKLRAGTAPMRYRALREYRDQYPDLVVIGQKDEYPELTEAIERQVPDRSRARMQPATLIGNHPDSTWAMADPGRAYLIYSVAGLPVELDLSSDANSYHVTWIGQSGGNISATVPGASLSLVPPQEGRPAAAWLSRTSSRAPLQTGR